MAGNALRVLGVAYREQDEDKMPDRTGNLTWLGLAGMADPMRSGMDRLIAQYHQAGIQTIMITGDQSATAQAIGRQLGLSGDKPLKVLESHELEQMDPELLAGLAKNVHVFARVSPAHKLKIVRALQEAGYVVAMTGDGINDGPALKAADVGVAMGGGGTNVARDVSDVVLEDDNLHTMIVAVEQGRTIYNNIRKMIHFMVSTNLTEIEVMLAGIAIGLGRTAQSDAAAVDQSGDRYLSRTGAGARTRRARHHATPAARSGRGDHRRPRSETHEPSSRASSGWAPWAPFSMVCAAMEWACRPAPWHSIPWCSTSWSTAYSSRSPYRNVFGGQELPPNPHLTKAILGMGGLAGLGQSAARAPDGCSAPHHSTRSICWSSRPVSWCR